MLVLQQSFCINVLSASLNNEICAESNDLSQHSCLVAVGTF